MAPKNRMAEKMEEEQPGPDWEQVTAWMNMKNPNWKRVEPKMRALAVRKARQLLWREKDQRMKALCREAAEWWPIVSKDPTAIERMPDTFQSIPFSPSNKDIFRKMRFPPPSPFFPSIADKYIALQRPRTPSPPPPPRISRSPPQLLEKSVLDEMYKKFIKAYKPPFPAPEEKEGLKMILIATLEEIRDRLPPESNQRRWFEAMLKSQE